MDGQFGRWSHPAEAHELMGSEKEQFIKRTGFDGFRVVSSCGWSENILNIKSVFFLKIRNYYYCSLSENYYQSYAQKLFRASYRFFKVSFATKKFRQIHTGLVIVEVEENEIPGS